MARISIKLIGKKELEAAFGDMAKGLKGPEAKRVVGKAAEPVKKAITTEAPFDPKRTTGFHLNESIEDGVFDDKPGRPVAAFVRVNSKKAPHGHLVQNGTVNQKANRFFTRGIQKGGGQANDILIKGYGDIFESRFKKGGKL